MKTRVSGKAQPAKTVFIIAVLVISFAACLYYGLFNSRTAASESEAENTGNSGDYLAFRDDQKNIGIYLDEMAEIDSLEEQPSLLGWFDTWFHENWFSHQKLKLCGTDHRFIPMITWQPAGVPLRYIASGLYDDYIESYLREIAEACPNNDVLIRFAHEMEMRPRYKNAWYSWQDERDPEGYIEAWRHIVSIGRKISPNFKWVWSPNRADEYTIPYYPGDEWVDYVGISLNLTVLEYYTTPYMDFSEYYETMGLKSFMEAYNKPIIISEAAYYNDTPALRESYFRSIFDHLADDPKICALLFFNIDASDDRTYEFYSEEPLRKIFFDGIRRLRELNSESD
ncbi:MAG: beta-mannanase [Lachnospiraceae bacterium]|nr:beta-mannanase [Lachnospiraceae bacterium]